MEAGSKIFQIYGVRWKAQNLCFAAVSPHAAIQWEPRRRGPTDSSIYALVVLTIFSAVPKIDRHRNHKPSRISVSKFKSGILSHFPCVVHNSNSCLGCMGSIKTTQFRLRWLNPPLTIGWCLTGLTIHSKPLFYPLLPRDDPLWPENPERCARHASAAPGSTGMASRGKKFAATLGYRLAIDGSETTNSWRYQHFKPFPFDRLVQLHAKRSLDALQNTTHNI